jgi:Domain of unknown function (DUF4174)
MIGRRLVLAAFLTLAPALAGTGFAADAVPPLVTLPAEGLDLAQFQWKNRLILVFADTDADPAFAEQLSLLADDPAALAERDVLVIIDSLPQPPSPARAKLRPHGFSLIWIDKDGAVRFRKASPWTVREVTQAIDKTPLRLQELADRQGR